MTDDVDLIELALQAQLRENKAKLGKLRTEFEGEFSQEAYDLRMWNADITQQIRRRRMQRSSDTECHQ